MTASRGSLGGVLALVWRQFGSERAATATIAGVVLVLSFLSAAAPRALEVLTGDEIAGSIAALPPTGRDLSARLLAAPPLGPASAATRPAELDSVWGTLDDALETIRVGLPAEAEATTSPAQYLVVTTAVDARVEQLQRFEPVSRIALLADPRMDARIRIVEGTWPGEVAVSTVDWEFFDQHGAIREFGPVEVVLTPTAADQLNNWAVGETRSMPMGHLRDHPVVLVGLFEPIDQHADYWQHAPTTLTASVFDDGNVRPIATAHGFVNPASWPLVHELQQRTPAMLVQTRIWFPVVGESITGSNAVAALRQFRQATSTVQVIGPVGSSHRVTFSTDAVDALDAVLSRSSATTSVLLMAAIGPFGVAIAVLILAGRLVAERRRPTLSLIAARGGSGAQLRSVLAIEGLVIGVPAAIAGAVGATLLIPSTSGPESVIVPALAGLAPAVVLALAASPGSLRRTRTDLGQNAGSRLRVAAEATLVVLTTVAVTLLLVRGIGAGSTGVDPLLVATPLLLALTASVAVLRLYPRPLALLERRLRGGSGAVAFLGTARSLRDRAAGLAPVLAMVVALSVGLFSSIILATLATGVTRAAESTVGADVRASGPYFVDGLVDAVAATPGVDAAVPVFSGATEWLTLARDSISVSVLYADLTALADLQTGLADAAPQPTVDAPDGSIPLVMSRSLLGEIDPSAAELRLGEQPVHVMAVTDRIAGSGARGHWVLIDRTWSSALSSSGFLPRVLLISFEPGADPQEARAGIQQAIGTSHSLVTRADAAAGLRSSPFASGLQALLAIVIVVVGALCALAIVLVSTINLRARTSTLAVLRVFGFSPRQSANLVAWELAPVGVTAFLAGALLGVALPLIVLIGVDLRAFTGGSVQPQLAIDPLLTLLVLGGFVAVVAASTAHSVFTSRRIRLAGALRGEE